MAATTVPQRAPGSGGRVSPVRSTKLHVDLDALRLSLCVLIALNVSRLHQHYSWMSVFRPGLVLVGLALGMAFMKPKVLAPPAWRKNWTTKAVAAITVSTLGS